MPLTEISVASLPGGGFFREQTRKTCKDSTMKDKPDPRHNLPKRRLTETRRIETPDGHTVHLSVETPVSSSRFCCSMAIGQKRLRSLWREPKRRKVPSPMRVSRVWLLTNWSKRKV